MHAVLNCTTMKVNKKTSLALKALVFAKTIKNYYYDIKIHQP